MKHKSTVFFLAVAWVLWHQIEETSIKGDATAWTVEDAFEDFKACKSEADKASARIGKATNKFDQRSELNAGFYYYNRRGAPDYNTTTEKWLCLPGGTNPTIILKNWTRKE